MLRAMRLHSWIFLSLLLLSSTVFAASIMEGLRNLVLNLVQPIVGIVFGLLIFLGALLYALGQIMGAEMRARVTVWSTTMLTGALLAAVLYAVLIWLVDPNVIENVMQSYLPSGLHPITTYVSLSLLFSAFVVVIFYLVAAFLQHPPMDAIKQEELAAFFMSILIVLGWGFLYFTMGNATRSLLCAATTGLCAAAGNFQAGHVDIAYFALEVLFVRLRSVYVNLYLYDVLIGFLSTISFPIGSQLPGLNIISLNLNPFEGLVLLTEAHTVLVEAIGYTMMVIIAKEHLLIFARDAIPVVLLPIGIMLRAFPWFRTTGSSLIAICIVGFFVYPLTILLSNYLIFDAYQPPNFSYVPNVAGYTSADRSQQYFDDLIADKHAHANTVLEDVFQGGHAITLRARERTVCGPGIGGLLCGVGNFLHGVWEVVGGFFHTVGEVTLFMWSFGGNFISSILYSVFPVVGASGGLYNMLVFEVVTVSQFVILVIFTSVLEIIITITAYRNIASLIGGEIEIAGLTKLV